MYTRVKEVINERYCIHKHYSNVTFIVHCKLNHIKHLHHIAIYTVVTMGLNIGKNAKSSKTVKFKDDVEEYSIGEYYNMYVAVGFLNYHNYLVLYVSRWQ